jgi:hypothetical protein
MFAHDPGFGRENRDIFPSCLDSDSLRRDSEKLRLKPLRLDDITR